mmetsp:Transcript_57640/g.160628  ORF Transcript_57640/g.160628 Transcript_57640/m.160628 type:complete len:332 (-) Transcript_57640:57-1052(-)
MFSPSFHQFLQLLHGQPRNHDVRALPGERRTEALVQRQRPFAPHHRGHALDGARVKRRLARLRLLVHEPRLRHIHWIRHQGGDEGRHEAGAEVRRDAVLRAELDEDLLALVIGGELPDRDDRRAVHVGHHARSPHREQTLCPGDLAHGVEDVLVPAPLLRREFSVRLHPHHGQVAWVAGESPDGTGGSGAHHLRHHAEGLRVLAGGPLEDIVHAEAHAAVHELPRCRRVHAAEEAGEALHLCDAHKHLQHSEPRRLGLQLHAHLDEVEGMSAGAADARADRPLDEALPELRALVSLGARLGARQARIHPEVLLGRRRRHCLWSQRGVNAKV